MSSKHFPILSDGIAESGVALKLVSQDIADAVLISAYDLKHGYLPDGEQLLSDQHLQTMYANPSLLIVDSGGYELNAGDFESGETHRGPYQPKPFSRQEFEAIADRLPRDRELLVVSYDSPERPRVGYGEQRERAQEFFESRQHLRSDFLLKPEGSSRSIDGVALAPHAPDLRYFDVIGVTEKELGDTLLERLVRLARLRALLDESGCGNKPIHVFGSLDPLMTPLYFMAGGEIFDGLSWLRYAYVDGLSVHPDQLGVLRGTISDRPTRNDYYRHLSNLQQLKDLRHRLTRWADEPDRYEHLGERHPTLREIHETVLATLAQKG